MASFPFLCSAGGSRNARLSYRRVGHGAIRHQVPKHSAPHRSPAQLTSRAAERSAIKRSENDHEQNVGRRRVTEIFLPFRSADGGGAGDGAHFDAARAASIKTHTAPPKGVETFGYLDGAWITDLRFVVPLAVTLRLPVSG